MVGADGGAAAAPPRGPRGRPRWRRRSGRRGRAPRRAARRAARRASRGSAPSRRGRRCVGRPRRPRRRRRSARHGPAPRRTSIGEAGEIGGDRVDRAVAARPVDADLLEDLAAQPDDGRGERIDRDLESEDDGAVGLGPDERRRAARACPAASARSSATRPPRRTRRSGRGSRSGSGRSGRRARTATAARAAWSSRTMALRLARRTVSLRWPSVVRDRVVTGFVILLPKWLC